MAFWRCLFIYPPHLAVNRYVTATDYLQLYDQTEGKVIWESPIIAEETFYHEYTHSVALTPVREYYKMNTEGNMVATESWVQSFGAGVPYERKDKLLYIDGFYVIEEEREVEALTIMPSSLFPHSFYFKENTVDLTTYEGHKLHIRIVRQ
ncbi:DUF1850 domain-containing protein [Halalkalibacter hemicellulosilyticus]|uniref:DUF1850 domain-containing protein n=1 Tax=Halalkalibacter hemicellulosilyticusJCM 9152 TaxID=1236971 RepID=W4QJD9_9BACI|nr:DUF1850 domain-containing protein [Halalkalibacter hemicellulosilyticus]GAE31429.1 hypothetical protein JCM9152_2898 [Halalkalibacter hemicellulosilyticusJCM 9152]